MSDIEETALVTLAAGIVSAYVANNRLPPADLADLITSVCDSIRRIGRPEPAPEPELVPAVNPKKSIYSDYIICLEDGKPFKSMKRHLASHGLTPQQYRHKWGLPADYPMTAPNYSAARSALARDIGLGQKPISSKTRRRKTS